MIYSMTGYGRIEQTIADKNIIIEIKSLNGKQMDINCKIAPMVKPFEIELRKIIQENLFRGSVDCNIIVLQSGASKPMHINTSLAKNYYDTTVELASSLGLTVKDDILPTIMNLPEVVAVENSVISQEEWNQISNQTLNVLKDLVQFRQEEGKGLEKELLLRVTNILNKLESIQHMDADRIEKIRERILRSLNGLGEDIQIDQNRLEQELIYYIEKIDISEEKQRLKQHCELFIHTIQNGTESGVGKKLNFILQEMGREINTLGSKAYDANIQKIIIDMKDELEKAKEQSLNVL